MPYGPSSNDLLDFLEARSQETLRAQRESDDPDLAAVENAELALEMVARSRQAGVWERRVWRETVLHLARVHEHHPEFNRAWYLVIWG